MGNHDVGRGMNAAAKGFWAGRNGKTDDTTSEEALIFLDAVAEEWRGADAEFDDYLHPDEPLGCLIAIAFSPGVGKENFFEEVNDKFRKRYSFC